MRLLLAAVAGLGLLLSSTESASAYSFLFSPPARWPAGNVPVRIQMGSYDKVVSGVSVSGGSRRLNAPSGSFRSADIGRGVLGPGIPNGAFIESIISSSSANMNIVVGSALSNITVTLRRVLRDGSPSWSDSVANAFAVWNEQMANIQVVSTIAPATTPASDLDGVTSVQFNGQVYQENFGSNTLAVALVNTNGTNQITESDIIFNSAIKWNSSSGNIGDNTFTDLHRVALHEIGHLLGLDHPDQDGQNVVAVMNSTVDGTSTLMVDDVQGAKALYGARAGAPSPAADGRFTGGGKLANISTRGLVGTGDAVMIGGFIIKGGSGQTKRVIARAIGPSMGLAGTLTNPTLELRAGNGALLASNDNWRDTQEQQIIDSTIPPGNDLEAALVADVPAGDTSYTVIVRGVNNSTGLALMEVYDLQTGDPATGQLANISTRGQVGTGDNVLIGGLINLGAQPKGVVIRAIGPSLAGAGVAGALANPVLELRNSNGDLVHSNDNYQFDLLTQQYGLQPSPQESAIGCYLIPGAHTAIVRGQNNSTGIGLVEVYGVE